MAYYNKVWENGDIITKEGLNHIEGGIYNLSKLFSEEWTVDSNYIFNLGSPSKIVEVDSEHQNITFNLSDGNELFNAAYQLYRELGIKFTIESYDEDYAEYDYVYFDDYVKINTSSICGVRNPASTVIVNLNHYAGQYDTITFYNVPISLNELTEDLTYTASVIEKKVTFSSLFATAINNAVTIRSAVLQIGNTGNTVNVIKQKIIEAFNAGFNIVLKYELGGNASEASVIFLPMIKASLIRKNQETPANGGLKESGYIDFGTVEPYNEEKARFLSVHLDLSTMTTTTTTKYIALT